MQSAEVVLSMLGHKSIQNSEFVFDRLYRNLFNPDFYLLAYSNIYAKEGNMAAGGDRSTPDRLDISMVEEIIALLKTENYYPRPVRSVKLSRTHGTLHASGGPSFQDILVEEIIRLLLQAIYEPLFKDTSHGFRPDRSCHTALVQLKTTCKGTHWVFKGDIKDGFERINQNKLLELLSRKLNDGRFLQLIARFLKAGYMAFRPVAYSLSGTPQGEIIAPILANIYLHELDTFMESICQRFSAGQVSTQASFQQTHLESLDASSQESDVRGEAVSRLADALSHQQPPVQVRYVRYADHFLVMLAASKQQAEQIRTQIEDFLQRELQLALDEDSLLINLKEQRVDFLGYEIARAREKAVATDPAQRVHRRATSQTIQLLVPGEIIREKIRPFVKNGKAVHQNARLNLSLLELLKQYNAEISSLYQYYCLATDVSTKLGMYRYYHYYSLLKTVARKEKCSIAHVLSKYGVEVKLKQRTGTRKIFGITYQTEQGTQTLTYFNDSLTRQAIQYQASC